MTSGLKEHGWLEILLLYCVYQLAVVIVLCFGLIRFEVETRPKKVKCIDFALAIAYIILVLGLLGWALFHQSRERSGASDREPLLKALEEVEDLKQILLSYNMMRTLF
ncbi:hypothetical protein CRYUN_Cryun09bG0036500 [Craigia yunnanensis]